jgi:Kef-type K+ transport system membrane component KefB
VFAFGLWLILLKGSGLEAKRTTAVPPSTTAISKAAVGDNVSSPQSILSRLLRTGGTGPLSILLLQIIVIIVAARSCAALFRKVGQPPVMGEILAGLLLGPSVLGQVAPSVMSFLFPPASLGTLGVLSQLGVVLFMFVVGMELDVEHLRQKATAAIVVSHTSIVVPFLMGAGLALFLYEALAPANVRFISFALFMGIAMSITAFPVLARILEDRRLQETPLGSMAITCAAIDDVTAWCGLALVIAIANSTGVAGALMAIGLTLCFIAIMLFIIKPWLNNFVALRVGQSRQTRSLLAVVLAFVLACAWLTESIGIHALFGAFLAGVVMPSVAGVRSFVKEKFEAFGSVALLPLFFAFTGLRTEIRLLNDWAGWLMCFAIVLVAVAGKLCGSMLAARWARMNWRDSFGLGVLMNTRGLIELVVLNIGYDLGILSGRIFVMLVIMALATTFMTAPLLSLAKIKKA